MELKIDTDLARLQVDAEHPYIIYGSPFDAEVKLQDGTGGNVSINEGDVFTLCVDDDWNFNNDNVMVYATATASTAGLVFENVETLTEKYKAVIDGKPSQRVYWQLNRNDGTASITIAQDWLTARGSVLPIDGTATVLQPLVIRAENAAMSAEASAEAAEEAAASIPSFPAVTPEDDGKVITISGGTFAYSDNLSISGLTVRNAGGFDQTVINGGTITATKITNGVSAIPFAIDVVFTSASSIFLEKDKSYNIDLSASTGIHSLICESIPGVELIWGVDITLGANASIQYVTPFDAENCDALTQGVRNRCVVRWDGSKAILKVYARESI